MSDGWDRHPVFFDYHGETLEFFTRGALAKALNRQVVTIRAMETKGVLCHPTIRTSTRQPNRGRYLYTREQVESLVKLAELAGVIDPSHRRPFPKFFIDKAHEILRTKPAVREEQ